MLHKFVLLIVLVFHIAKVRSSSANMDLCAASKRPSACPVKCFSINPVCGENGVTYWCGCEEAICWRTKVAKLGFCKVRDGQQSGSMFAQVMLLVHIVWLILVAFYVLFGFL
ncbi:hypothetical protein ACFE04_003221 [Oxalis oulophora]